MYAKLKPNEIPIASVNMNVFPTAGFNSPETVTVKSLYMNKGASKCAVQHQPPTLQTLVQYPLRY
jgi:hypothetical protein